MRFEASYELTPDDAVGSWRMHNKGRGYVRLPYPELVLPSSTIVAAAVAIFYELPAGGLVLAAGCFYCAPLFYEWWLRLAAIRQSGERIAVVFADKGVAITTRAGSHRHGWSEVLKVLIDDWGVVCYGSWGFVFIPSRAFEGEYPRNELREFITRHIQNG